jgi:two-component system cell cycle sensor histidine kinase/response regulator CckA
MVLDWDIEEPTAGERIREIRTAPIGSLAAIVAVVDTSDPSIAPAVLSSGADDVIIECDQDSVRIGLRLETAAQTAIRRFRSIMSDSNRHSHEDTYRALFHHLPCGVYESTPEGRFLNVNDALREILGYNTMDEVFALDIGRDLYVDPSQRTRLLGHLEQVNTLEGAELVFRRRDGSSVVLLENAFVRRDADGQVLSYVGTLVDITGRMDQLSTLEEARSLVEKDLALSLQEVEHANEMLRIRNRELEKAKNDLEQSETRFRTLVESLSESIYRCDHDGVITYASPAVESLLGLPLKEIIGRRWSDFVLAEEMPNHRGIVDRVIRGESTSSVFRLRAADGSIRWVRSSVTPSMHNGEFRGFQGIFSDITAQLTAEQASAEAQMLLDRRNRFMAALMDTIPNAVFHKDTAGRYQGCNRAFEILFDTTEEELIGKTAQEMWYPDDATVFDTKDEELLKNGGIQVYRTTVQRYGKESVEILYSKCIFRDEDGTPAGIVGVATDVTEIRDLKERLGHAEKMEALGQLAGSIAHEFNNLIMVVRGTTQLMSRQVLPGDPLRGDLELVLQTTQAAADLSRSLLAFSRRQVLDKTIFDLCEVISSLEPMLKRLLPPDIGITQSCEDSLPKILADQSSIERAVINLVLNSRDAIRGRGRIELSVQSETVDSAFVSERPWIRKGRYVKILVKDDGIGMDKATIDRIFDPFFTTKEAGRGTGLGMASVYGAMKQHNGYVVVDSEPSVGTTVSLYLPETRSEPALTEPSSPHVPIRAATETVLVVEDSTDLREVMIRFLQSLGYTTLEAADGNQALEVLHRDGARIHAVVTDLVMPGLDGIQLVKTAKQRWPHLGFVLCSGDRGRFEDTAPVLDGTVVRLEKPFDIEDIGNRLEDVLDSSGVIRIPDALLEPPSEE